MQGNQQIKGRWRRKPTQKLPFKAPHLLRNGPWSIRMRPPVLPYSLSSPAPLSEIRTGLSWCHELCSVSRLWWYGAKSSVLGSRVLLRHRVLVHTCLWPQSRAAMDSRYVHSPLQWQSELRAPAPGGELARPSTGVHRMGMLRGTLVCFQKPLWLVFWPFPLPFPFPPDLHLPRSSSTREREVGSRDCEGLKSATISSHS